MKIPDRDALTKNIIPSDGCIQRNSKADDSVMMWDCPCGYSFHTDIKVCRKCGNHQPIQNKVIYKNKGE